jgi:glycerol-3-phosphate dehydrogenase
LIARDPKNALRNHYDLAVVGGGIHGISIALEATRRGRKVLLVEAGDYGCGASGNSLRILHGGLRYLQSADLLRFRESVAERRWYARTFPQFIDPLPCLMPLYARGLKRRSVMRVALAMNDLLASRRNDGVSERVRLPHSETFGTRETQDRFRHVRSEGLEGSALWYDYSMRSSERVLIEMLHWACSLGACALNYVKVSAVRSEGGKILGLTAEDQLSRERYEFQADRICNSTGSQARVFAAAHDRDYAELFIPSVAFNVLFDCERLADAALAVAAPEPGAPLYFLCPSPFGIWAGTEHVARADGCVDATVTEAELVDFIGRINRAIPTLKLSLANIRRVFSGLLPVRHKQTTDLTAREAIVDHGSRGGLSGLYSVTGIKFTTARKVGEKAVDRMFGPRPGEFADHRAPRASISSATDLLLDGARVGALTQGAAADLMREVAAAESVTCAEDLWLRRSNWAFTAPDLAVMKRLVEGALRTGPVACAAADAKSIPVAENFRV